VPSDLAIDQHGKGLFHEKLYPSHIGYETVEPRYALVSEGNRNLIFTAQTYGGTVYKEMQLGKNNLSVGYSFDKAMRGFLEVELNLSMPSCDGPAGRYWVNGHCPGGFGQLHHFTDLTELALEDDVLGGSIVLHSDQPLIVTARPFFTVSQSEAGFEKIMQAVTLIIHYPFAHDVDALQLSLEIYAKGAN
jgi:4-alpha-glucanotransferase